MPATVNGIGTQYYGKKNPRYYEGICESCGRNVTLSDYETGYYFVVLFIPIIPLGKKQIIGDCSVCRRHRVMPLHQWEEIREESLESGLSELAEHMDDPSKAIELLGRMTVFNRMDEAMDLAAATVNQHADDFDTQIEIGAWYEHHQKKALAEQCFSRAISLDPDHPTSHRIEGMNALEAGKPADAANHFQSLRQSNDYYDPAIFFMLAQAYQGQGMHREALDEFKDLIDRNPETAKDKTLRKMVKKSEKELGETNTILPKTGWFG